jgi:D-sedoheptulose 7-phosphate isomerase
MTPITNVESYFALLSCTIQKMQLHSIDAVTEVLLRTFENEKTIYVFGNGGSASLASHFACDLGKGTVNGSGKRFRIMALTDNLPLITAWANDSSYDHIFAEQLTNFVSSEDVAFAISGSGNSRNVINALRVARKAGATTLGITGFKGGAMKDLCDECIIVPSDNMQIIEDMHLSIAHSIFTAAKAKTCRAVGATA